MNTTALDLRRIFNAVAETLALQREFLNREDTINSNHGDHMVEIFRTATQSVELEKEMDLVAALKTASLSLSQLAHNGSAQVYAQGLVQFADQFEAQTITLDDLVAYIQSLLGADTEQPRSPLAETSKARQGDVLKALVAGLIGWRQLEAGEQAGKSGLDMGNLFELGMTYLQAKQRGGTKLEILADAASSASPLSRVAYRQQSGKLAIQTLLQAIAASTT